MIQDWIFEDNLEPVLEILATFAGYSFDAGDRAAIETGLKETDVERDIWFAYELAGPNRIRLALARDPGASVLFVRAEADPQTALRIETVITVAQWYWLRRE